MTRITHLISLFNAAFDQRIAVFSASAVRPMMRARKANRCPVRPDAWSGEAVLGLDTRFGTPLARR